MKITRGGYKEPGLRTGQCETFERQKNQVNAV
jgi:hypothetical protein